LSLDPEQRKELQDHFHIVNEWAKIESEIKDLQKYTVVGGFWWRLCNWFLRKAERGRKEAVDDKNEYLREIEKSGR
jgi:hypothetical protein